MEKLFRKIRVVEFKDRKQLTQLLEFGIYVHRHLDWFDPVDWIGQQPFFAIEGYHQIKAVLACPPDPGNIAWIRLFAMSGEITPQYAWGSLWSEVLDAISGKGLTVAVIPIYPWFRSLITDSDFEHYTNVVLFEWSHFPPPPYLLDRSIRIRDMGLDDISVVSKLDMDSFDPLWQNSQRSLEIAWIKSALSTVAEANGKIVGYQISTASSSSGHLARLAVLPDWQGCGIGTALVNHMLARFHQWGALRVTVNTQVDNKASLALYQKIGFVKTKERYPVYGLTP